MRKAFSKPWFYACFAVAGALASMPENGARAQDATTTQDRLFQAMLRSPKNLDVTFAYAKVASSHGDYEAAIGALERVLFFQPDLARVKYELGSLYFRLGSYEMARRYFKEALASPDLDPITRDLIETSLPDAEKQLQASRFSGFLQTGARFQTNASYAPVGNTIRLGGQDLSLLSPSTRKADTNWFGLAGISHDYDFGNQRGDVLETRFVGYITEQARLNALDVGLFDVSVGPRFALAPDVLPGATVKPYLVGGNTWVGGSSYLASGGAGITANFPVMARFSVEPGFEWRRVGVNTASTIPVSTLASGDTFTAGLSTTTEVTEHIHLAVRGAYQHADTRLAFQSYNQWVGEAALTFAFAPPVGGLTRDWSVSPFVRVIGTDFEAANPFIDATTRRRDSEQIAGAVFEAPVTKTFGVSATVQYDHTGSTLANYRLNNLSVVLGPTARF